ncbi:hypothetical protein DF947_07065 [Pedobacter paludis]|uniref:Uncharacterized protein n=1 Tax=Pedobacter paludis TaxID=2203212 RepID=A0A317F1Z8_9SPHI|nr:hypothetical protein DF947_07065 [Pedobacter paludis]
MPIKLVIISIFSLTGFGMHGATGIELASDGTPLPVEPRGIWPPPPQSSGGYAPPPPGADGLPPPPPPPPPVPGSEGRSHEGLQSKKLQDSLAQIARHISHLMLQSLIFGHFPVGHLVQKPTTSPDGISSAPLVFWIFPLELNSLFLMVDDVLTDPIGR